MVKTFPECIIKKQQRISKLLNSSNLLNKYFSNIMSKNMPYHLIRKVPVMKNVIFEVQGWTQGQIQTNFILTSMGGLCVPQFWVLYHRPESLKILCRISAISSIESSGQRVLRWSLGWWMFLGSSFLQLLLLLLPHVATLITTTFITTTVFWSLSTTTVSGWLASTCLPICIWKSYRS